MAIKKHRSWKHQNLVHIIVGIGIAVALSQNTAFHQFLLHLGSFSYVGAFVAGVLFVSTFTVGVASVILFSLAQQLPPLPLAFVAGAGAVMGDFFIMHVIGDTLKTEIRDYPNRKQLHKIEHLIHTKYFNWILPVIGAVIIASPLPNELGITLIGLTNMHKIRFIFLSYFLNTIGIGIALSAGRALGA